MKNGGIEPQPLLRSRVPGGEIKDDREQQM